ncbi:MAG: Ig-like domain-containing protein, partial [Verrucomicrobiota bacterium]
MEDTPVTNFAVLPNDSDPDGDALTVSTASALNGTVSINPDGTINYTPNENFTGTDAIIYTVRDPSGAIDVTTVRVTVTPVNDLPIAVDDTATTAEDTAVDIPVLSNDSDVEGTPSVTAVTDGSHGTVSINPDGTVKYTPEANFHGTDTFTYTITDSDGDTDTATVSVTIASENDPPVAVDDSASTTEDNAVDITVLSNDSDVEDTPTVTAVTDGSHGTVSINPDGTVKYTPEANFHGTDTFTYTISDSEGATDTATVTVTVASVDDFPEAKDDAFSTDEDVVLSGDLATNDTLSGDGGNLFGKVTDPSHGSVTVNADGTFDYTPDAEFSGTDSFIYSLTDANGDVSNATAVITINYVNDEPTPSPDVSATGEDLGVAIDVSTNDSDPEGDPVGVVEINGQTASVGIPVGLSSGATATLLSDGTIYYDPNGAYDELKNGQTDTDTFSYGSGDGDGITATTVTVTVTGSDDAVNNNAFQVTGGQLNYLAFDPSTTSFVNTPIGDNPGNAGNYNAMAFNSVDSQLYAIDGSNLIRIDPENGEVTIIASGLTDSEYTGDFNPGDGYLYAKRGNSSDWNVYNVQDGTKVTSFTQSTSASFNDIA